MTSLFTRLFRTMSTTHPDPIATPPGSSKAVVAAGCFWGVEHLYRKHFKPSDGLLDARVGYIGGKTSSPSYNAVCSGRTGHAEALLLVFDPTKLSYQTIIEFFYRMHDPTTKDRQGPDTGSQYRSGIFTFGEEQDKEAREITEKVGKQWWTHGRIVTEIQEAGEWWDAEAYHQKYLDVNPGGYECPSHYLRTFPDLK